MTELEGPITNDQFLSCTSASIATAWCTKSFWDWTTFLVFQVRQEFTNSRELTFSLVRWTQLRQDTWWYGSSSYLGLPKWIKRIVHFLEKANVQPRGLYQPVFTGFKIYYQIVSRQSNCKMVWTKYWIGTLFKTVILSVQASLCCRGTGEKEKESARGTMGREKKE